MREKIWTLTSAFLDGGPIAFFLFWLIIGAFNLPQDGKTLMLFRIGPAYYIGHPLSLVCFSLLYFLLRYGYGYLKTLSMLAVAYGTWELAAQSWYITRYTGGNEVLMIYLVIFGLWWSKPSINWQYAWFGICSLAVCVIIGLQYPVDGSWGFALVTMLLVFDFVLLTFRPRLPE